MTELTATFRTFGPSDVIPDDYVGPYHLTTAGPGLHSYCLRVNLAVGSMVDLEHQKIAAHPRPAAGQ